MKIGISSTADKLESQIDPRLGRCQYFLIVDTDNNDLEVIDNQKYARGCSAGVKTARQIIAQKVNAVITGKCGPKAMQEFLTAGIDVYTGQAGTVKSVIDNHQNGKLTGAARANLVLHAGMGEHGHGHGQCTCREQNQQAGEGADNETCRANTHQ